VSEYEAQEERLVEIVGLKITIKKWKGWYQGRI